MPVQRDIVLSCASLPACSTLTFTFLARLQSASCRTKISRASSCMPEMRSNLPTPTTRNAVGKRKLMPRANGLTPRKTATVNHLLPIVHTRVEYCHTRIQLKFRMDESICLAKEQYHARATPQLYKLVLLAIPTQVSTEMIRGALRHTPPCVRNVISLVQPQQLQRGAFTYPCGRVQEGHTPTRAHDGRGTGGRSELTSHQMDTLRRLPALWSGPF